MHVHIDRMGGVAQLLGQYGSDTYLRACIIHVHTWPRHHAIASTDTVHRWLYHQRRRRSIHVCHCSALLASLLWMNNHVSVSVYSTLLIGRIIQGAGIGGINPLRRLISADIMTKHQRTRYYPVLLHHHQSCTVFCLLTSISVYPQ